jgi:formate/nitrite transporter FocA (FNT family)
VPADQTTRRRGTPTKGPAPAAVPSPRPGEDRLDDPYEPHSVVRTVRTVADMALEKASHPLTYFLRSLVGGGMVAFGVLLSLVVSSGVTVPGLASLLMGLAFGMSLVLILVSQMSLITADMAAGAMAVFARRLSIGSVLRMLTIGMAGNIGGAAIFSVLVGAAGGPYLGPFAQRAAAVAAAKVSQPIITQILLGILCTWFLQTAMFLYFKARSDVAKMGFAFYGPFSFVIGGTQHVIANVGFLGIPLLLAAFHSEAPATAVTWGFGAHGLLTNLVFATVGNFIGGTIFVALAFHLIAKLQESGR